jgi:hypothetical protein
MTRFHTDDYIRFLQRVAPELYTAGTERLADRKCTIPLFPTNIKYIMN